MDAIKATFDPETLISRVEQLIDSNQLRAARPLLAAVRRISKPNANLAQLSARLSLRDGALEEARRGLDEAIHETPDHPGLRKCRADLRQRLGDWDGAARDAAEAVILDRFDPRAKALLGAIMIELGRPVDAATCLAEALLACPEDVLVREALAAACEMAGYPEAALATLEAGFVVNPTATVLRGAAILLCVKTRKFEHAVRLAEDARAAGLADSTIFGLMGHALSNLGRQAEAEAAYTSALQLEPSDPYVRHLVAAAKPMNDAGGKPFDYLRQLFDDHAPRFDAHLLSLGYRVPEAIAALMGHHPRVRRCQPIDAVLDLGCGTGMMGACVQDLEIRTLVGVDLSPGMLAEARHKSLYGELHQNDLMSHLNREDRRFDFILAADVICYLGDLQPVFEAINRCLARDGWFIFSVEALLVEDCSDTDGWKRLLHGRHAHSDTYITEIAGRTGLRVESISRPTIRYDGAIAVPGYVVALTHADGRAG